MSIVDGYTAAVGSNASVTDNHKVCQINININYPANLQYTIVNNTYSGYLNLGYGVNGTHNTTVSWGGKLLEHVPRTSIAELAKAPRSHTQTFSKEL